MKAKELLTEASYEVMGLKPLRKTILSIYNQNPKLYYKYRNAVKPFVKEYQRKAYEKNFDTDFEKIACVFASGTKDDELKVPIESYITKAASPIAKVMEPAGLSGSEALCDIQLLFFEDTISESYHILTYYVERYEELHSDDIYMNRLLSGLFLNLKNSERFYRSLPEKQKEIDDYTPKGSAKAIKKAAMIELTKALPERLEGTVRRWYLTSDSLKEDLSNVHENLYIVNNILLGNKGTVMMPEQSVPKSGEGSSYISTVAEDRDKKLVFSEDIYCAIMHEEITREYYEYQLRGIDMGRIARNHPLTSKEVSKIVDMVFLINESTVRIGSEHIDGKIAIVRDIVERAFTAILLKERDKMLKDNTATTSSDDDKEKGILEELYSENEALKKTIESKKNIESKVRKENKEKEDKLLDEIRRLKKRIEKLETKKPGEVEKKEDCKEADEIIEKPFTEDDFVDFISNHKILFWGARDSLRSKLENLYPDIDFIDSDAVIKNYPVESYEGAIIKADYTSHTKYYSARDLLRNLGIPMVCLDNRFNNEKRLWEAGKVLKNNIEKLLEEKEVK